MTTIFLIYISGFIFCLISFYVDYLYGEDFEVDMFPTEFAHWIFWTLMSVLSWGVVIINLGFFFRTWKSFFETIIKTNGREDC